MADKKFSNKIKLGTWITPIGVAVYPHLTKPDTKYKAEGEYRTKLKYDGSTAEGIRPKLEKWQDEAFEKFKDALEKDGKKAKSKSLKKAELPLKPETDEDGDETGAFLLNAKRTATGVSKKTGETWKAKIEFADALGRKVSPKGLSIWSGSELRLAVTVFGWYGAKDNEVGVSFDIDGVQIKSLVAGGGREVSFDAVDESGWTPSDSEDEPDSADEDEGEDAGDDETPDF